MHLTVLMTGSRKWSDPERIYRALEGIQTKLRSRDPEHTFLLVHGGALGADTMAADAATRLGWEIHEMPADWSKGRRAGLDRNIKMVRWVTNNCGQVLCLAFISGESRGTHHCMTQMKEAGLTVVEYVEIS